ncbi:alpha/beta fold hydrolase [Synechococcales cyanobacterium C]|uniref:Alpha/beta fold hydrolase n=1 Tax=Petrachloros mirabilis ULC683 TaxID=2781853 RepID=A0A8K1ZYT7_9CYAN|nr:alpha/beta hydrolase [Petrachloros mirabilis]NCJ06172.1 alpha/beta fold hydrolase [Petrachloros mirabilis ULC683]
MHHLTSPAQVTVSYDQCGSGPALVLVHGSFSDHKTNWALIKPLLEQQFTVYAIARRGRGESDATQGHSVTDEGQDVAALIESIHEPVFLLGHSYGAQVTLAAASAVPERVRKLVLYEPPWPHIILQEQIARFEELARAEDWEVFTTEFLQDIIAVQVEELETLQGTEHWNEIVFNAETSLSDLWALSKYTFNPADFRELRIPVMLQIGTESPRDLYVTDALAAVLPDVRIEALPGQAHEGMNTAPKMYAEAVARFFLGSCGL